jgi:hypothetical protein
MRPAAKKKPFKKLSLKTVTTATVVIIVIVIAIGLIFDPTRHLADRLAIGEGIR